MIRGATVLLGLTLGFGLVLATEGRMLHLRHFIASAEPDWAQDASDATGLFEAFCAHSNSGNMDNAPNVLSIAGVLHRFCDPG